MNNNDSSVPTSSSEITLIEENISAYCEPFGKALPPPESVESVIFKRKKTSFCLLNFDF